MEFNCLIPKNMIDFKCIGDKCEDSCCIGWRIELDKQTCLKYKSITNKQLRTEIVEKISFFDKGNDAAYANIILENDKCPFLKEGLCSIQNKLGHHYLSNTCRVYPRKILCIDDLVEISHSLSCPEVVRNLILDENPMEFNVQSFDLDYIVSYYKTNVGSQLDKYFWDIRGLAIEIIQNRNIEINKRVIILGMFLKNISEGSNVEDCIRRYKMVMKEPMDTINELDKLKGNDDYCRSLFKALFDIFKNSIMTRESRLESLKKLFEIEYDSLFEQFIQIYKNQYVEFEKSTEYILENMIVHYIYDSKIPLTKKNGSVIDKYNAILLHVFFYRMLTVLHYLTYKNFDFDLGYYVQKIGLIFDHNKNIEIINEKLKMDDTKFAHILAIIII